MNTLHTGNELGRGALVALLLHYYAPRVILVAIMIFAIMFCVSVILTLGVSVTQNVTDWIKSNGLIIYADSCSVTYHTKTGGGMRMDVCSGMVTRTDDGGLIWRWK